MHAVYGERRSMPKGVTAIPVTLREDPSLELDPRFAASFGADNLLLSSFVVTLGIPLFFLAGRDLSPPAVAVYTISAVVIPCCIALLVWWVRWNRPCAKVCRLLVKHVLLFSVPAAVLVYVVVIVDQRLSLVGISIMAFAAAVSVTATSAVFDYDVGRRGMRVLRIAAVLATPAIIIGMADAMPRGLIAVQAWSIPVVIAAAGAFGAYKAIQRHSYEHAAEQKVTIG